MCNTKYIIEAILFASGDAISIKDIMKTTNLTRVVVSKIIDDLSSEYKKDNRGIYIIKIEDKYQMCTNPIYSSYLKIAPKKSLSKTSLETLAIIAYKQPVTRSEIENIRGVNCEHSINFLIKYNLIEEKGRLNAVGKPIIFGTTDEFLKYFGFSSLNNLPNIVQ